MPPTGDEVSELSMAMWLSECAKVINLAASDSAGGMLVLMSGYDRLEKLAVAIVRDFPALVPRLVVQSRLTRIATLASVFKARARAGDRPIWLATGSAWTGLDLADELVGDDEPQKDLLLTDLVIPNLPFGLQRNTTHVAKVSNMGFGIERIATQRMFRNGLGRGVRREGLTHRRYWVLDGRLQHPATANYTADLRRVLQLYLHRQQFIV
jgi:CRISPR type IV-associated DEAD/DEAH-box helicase Csf4